MVEKGVNERVRLAQIYKKKEDELEKQHEEIRQSFNDLKNKVSACRQRCCAPGNYGLFRLKWEGVGVGVCGGSWENNLNRYTNGRIINNRQSRGREVLYRCELWNN